MNIHERMPTSVLQVRKGNQKKDFFTVPEYLQWNEQYNKDGKWSAKYYKVGILSDANFISLV